MGFRGAGGKEWFRRVGKSMLLNWINTGLLTARCCFPFWSITSKADASFIPMRDSHTHRWHLRVGDREFELLTSGPKWFDTRLKLGGGGGIDLAMHLLALDFRQAVTKLRQVL